MKLSAHFDLSEFERSATASRYGIDNQVPPSLIPNLRRLCDQVLEPLRAYAGRPIVINSGYRSPQLNFHSKVRGSARSQHMTGEAVDIRVPDSATGNRWFLFLMNHCPFDQLIRERPTRDSDTFWIHVSLKASDNRRQVISNLIKD